MGSCCCSCEEEEGPEPDEQARLLEPPGEQDRASTSDSQSCPDEQAVLASILARAASSIIAVGAAQVQRLAPQECLDRARLYRSRLAQLNRAVVSGGGGGGSYSGLGSSCGSGISGVGVPTGGGLLSYWKKKEPSNMALPTLTNHPYRVLAGALVPYADVQLAIHIAVDAHRAMQHVRVQPSEELVVKFEVV
ncbi:ragulator complex protein LAMTOR1-like [Monodelphis domestica]|uniref:ragulator complex protein LAMTOR1-like n=1 Tax=Monodelphis domestica TaxID=13616 RepID=UPI0024E20EF5|nr:ragulator complex protein LAMTOR1-like [Monodelphis domestica]